MFRLRRFLKGYKKQLILGPLFKLTEAVFELIVPLIMARIIDIGVKNNDIGYVWTHGAVLLVLGIVGLCCALTCQYYASVASQGVGTSLRNALYKKINSFSHAEIDFFGPASLSTRITNDVNQLQYAVAMLIRLVIRAPFIVIGSIIMAFIIEWRLALIILAATPLMILAQFLIMTKTIPFFKKMQKKLERVFVVTSEALSGARVIRAFARQRGEETRFKEAVDEHAKTGIAAGRFNALLNPITYVIMNLGIVLLVWISGYRVNTGSLSQGQIIALVNYMTQIILSMVILANLVLTFTRASASASRVNEVFDTETSITEDAADVPASKPDSPAVVFDNVSFRYKGSSEYAIEQINMSIPSGSTVGIIGGTGSGKSTLISLIPRFYDASEGKIEIFGNDIKSYPLSSLRAMVRTVEQTAGLLSGTVAENIRLGKPDASDSEVWQSLTDAQAYDFIKSKADALDTSVEEGGKNFSGGQRQRLSIARALIGDPEILILDDSLSALDAATDLALRRTLLKVRKNRTTIIIAQRVASIMDLPLIYVMDDGKIAASGDHSYLLKNCPLYTEICSSQNIGGEVTT